MAGLEVEVLTSPEELLAVRGEWDDFAANISRPSPFLTATWLGQRWSHLGLAGRVVVLRRGGRIRGALPLSIATHRGRVGRFLAGSYVGLDAMLAPDEPPSLVDDLIAAAHGAPLDYLELSGFDEHSLVAAAAGGTRALRLDGSPSLDLSAGWEATYRRQTSSKTRNTHRRKLRRLENEAETTFRIARSAEELDAALDETFRLHDLRWTQRSDFDLSNYSRHQSFHRAVARQFAENDMARIVLLVHGGETIAFTYCFVYAKTLFLHRLAFDPRFALYSPGLLVTLRTLAEAGAEGLERVEFLRGCERYKLELADSVAGFLWVAGWGRGSRGRALAAARRLTLSARQYAKASSTLRGLRHNLLRRTQGS